MNFYSPETGLKLHSDKVKSKQKVNIDWDIELLEALVFIQEKTQAPITMPKEQPPPEHINHIFGVAEIIKEGKQKTESFPLKSVVALETAKKCIEIFNSETITKALVRSDDWKTTILKTEIDLGRGVIATDVFIAERDFKKIERDVAANKNSIEFILTPKEKFIVIDYLKWDCEDRHTRIQFAE
ncbi:MAG TPA: hypothetical protein VF644_10595 [Pyrinomonadaceae bacterium]|jgi:hypothetical protein